MTDSNTDEPSPRVAGISPLASVAGVGTVDARILDADNGVVSLGGANDSAAFSFASWTSTGYTTRYYTLRVELSEIPSDKPSTLEVTLPLGMAFQYTNITTFLNTQPQFKSDLAESPAASYAHAGLTSEGGYTFPNGSYTFTLAIGTKGTTVDIPISFDPSVVTDHITNAVQVKLTNSAGSAEDFLEEAVIDYPKGLSQGYHADANRLY
jgi:hypothetical protein